MKCKKCVGDLPKDGDFITCGRCGGSYHYQCSGVQKKTWQAKSAKKKTEWECLECRNTKSDQLDTMETYEEVAGLKKLMEKMFTRQEKLINEKLDNVTAVITEFEDRILVILDQMKKMEEENILLRKDLEELKTSMEVERQYGRSKNFIITSIPQKDKEKSTETAEKVVQLLDAMGTPMKKEEFTAHRLPSKKTPAPIIVQCNTRATRDNIVRNCRRSKPDLSILGKQQPKVAIYFNDHLTKYFANLMIKAKQVQKEKGYKYLWLNGGKLMARKNDLSRAISIIKEQDLENMK